MRVLAHAVKKRGEDTADGTGIDTAVGMAAHTPIHRTGIEAGAAADALQTLTEGRAEYLRASVVENHQVKLFRSIQLTGAAFSRQKGGIYRQSLSGCPARQQLQEHGQIAKPGDDFFLEWNTYRREVGRLLAEGHEGKWVLIKGETVVGLYNTADEAMAEGGKRFSLDLYMVEHVQAERPIYRIRGYC